MVERRVAIVIEDKVDASIFSKIDMIGKKAADAETRLQGLQSKLNGIGGGAVDRMTAAQERLAVSTNKTAATTEQLSVATQRAASQQEQMATATDKAANSQSRYNQMVNNTHNVQAKLTKSTGQVNRDLANLTYQLNDIGVSLAGGQNPFLVMIQQGSQIGQIYGGNGITGILKGMLGGIMSIISANLISATVLATLGVAFYKWHSDIERNLGIEVGYWDTLWTTIEVGASRAAKKLRDEFDPAKK